MTYQPLTNPLPVQPAQGPTTPNPDPSLGQIVVLLTHILAALRAANLMRAVNTDDNSGLTDLDVISAESEFLP